jgi:hypothetical protein
MARGGMRARRHLLLPPYHAHCDVSTGSQVPDAPAYHIRAPARGRG